jgi:hypothetical protein
VRPGGIVVLPPRLDQGLSLAQIGEDFPRQQLVAQLAVEAAKITLTAKGQSLQTSAEFQFASSDGALFLLDSLTN